MQLQMSAPLDIGLEQQDGQLHQDDIFDLEDAERRTSGKRTVSKLIGQTGEDAESDEDEGDKGDDDEQGDGAGESDEEGARMRALEAELDGLYDTYKQKRNERDAKFRAKEARKYSEKEEWYGMTKGEGESDEEGSGSGSDAEDGGWDKMMRTKAAMAVSSSDESSDDDTESESPDTLERPKKRKADSQLVPPTKKTRLVSNLRGSATMNRSTQMWFDQDIFKDVDMDDIEEEGESEADSTPGEVDENDDRSDSESRDVDEETVSVRVFVLNV
jgi:AdoMet-dependent rRNA methyltransferase SPB1